MRSSHILDATRVRVIRPIVTIFPAGIRAIHLTLLRLLLVVPLGILLTREQWVWAIAVYIIAAITDALDGELARVRHDVSALGARLDPLVDKVLQITVAVIFLPDAPLLLGGLILIDLLLAFLGSVIAALPRFRGQAIHANMFGKWKFTFQTIALLCLFMMRVFSAPAFLSVAIITGSIALLFAILSLAQYVRTFFSVKNISQTRSRS